MELIKIPVNKKKYRDLSAKVHMVMKKYDANFHPIGLDEGYLNLTELVENKLKTLSIDDTSSLSNKSSKNKMIMQNEILIEIMLSIQKEVFETTGGLTISVGVACNRFLAKLCSEVKKPKGIYLLRRDKSRIINFLDKFDLRKIKHIGPHKERIFKGLGKIPIFY